MNAVQTVLKTLRFGDKERAFLLEEAVKNLAEIVDKQEDEIRLLKEQIRFLGNDEARQPVRSRKVGHSTIVEDGDLAREAEHV